MWMTDYIREIQRQLIAVYGLSERHDMPGVPSDVPDGEYPMVIDGTTDHVRVVNGKVSCCNFNE